MSKSVGEVSIDLTLDDKEFSRVLNNTMKQSENFASNTMNKISGYITKAFAVGSILAFGKFFFNKFKAGVNIIKSPIPFGWITNIFSI